MIELITMVAPVFGVVAVGFFNSLVDISFELHYKKVYW